MKKLTTQTKEDLEEAQMEKLIYRILWVVLAIGALGMMSLTAPKLYKMAQIRGWLEGANVIERTITDKASEDWQRYSNSTNRMSSGTTYWIAWNEQRALEQGPNRINLERADWEALSLGSKVEIIRFPNDDHAYMRSGIFASNGNFGFDIFLLLAELAVIINSVVRLIRLR